MLKLSLNPNLASKARAGKLLLSVPNKDISYVKTVAGIINQFFNSFTPDAGKYASAEYLINAAVAKNCTHIGTTDFATFKLFDPLLEGTSNENIGSIITVKINSGNKLRVCLLPPLWYSYAKNEGNFLIERFIRKLHSGTSVTADSFNWEFCTPGNIDHIAGRLDASFLTAVDIETSKVGRKITSVSYTGCWPDPEGHLRSYTWVVPCNSTTYPWCITAMRRFNLTASPKVMQNGQYDSVYFLRFNAPLYNYIYDTYHLFHAIYPELPKDLAFISSFYLDNFRFWKDEGSRNLYEYNGKDTHNTLWTLLGMIFEMPDYAPNNYATKFKLVFPCISCELDGFNIDEEEQAKNWSIEDEKAKTSAARLQKLLSVPNFNPGSPKQVMQMFQALGYKEAKDTSDLSIIKFGEKDPLFLRLAELIQTYRAATKARSTYFEIELFEGRLFYKLDPSGTETGRMSSKSGSFWCGTQIQNIPPYARGMVVSLPGWSLAGIDKSQSESYCTAYISQDLQLIKNVTTSPDFHCSNASMFFGMAFDELYDVKLKKVLNKAIRKLAKPINHGANYNMGAKTLVDTIISQMGSSALIEIRKLLKLPATMSYQKVAQKALDRFDKVYPRLRSLWYNEIVMEVLRTGKLVTPVGYVRRTFMNPRKSVADLNACVAHKPQSTSVHLVNEAFYKIWRDLQLKKYRGSFRLKAQVHDEIIPMIKDWCVEIAANEVAEMMVIPTVINGRTMTIPSTVAIGKTWDECKD